MLGAFFHVVDGSLSLTVDPPPFLSLHYQAKWPTRAHVHAPLRRLALIDRWFGIRRDQTPQTHRHKTSKHGARKKCSFLFSPANQEAGDAIPSCPRTLKKQCHEARVLLPSSRTFAEVFRTLWLITVGPGSTPCGVHQYPTCSV